MNASTFYRKCKQDASGTAAHQFKAENCCGSSGIKGLGPAGHRDAQTAVCQLQGRRRQAVALVADDQGRRRLQGRRQMQEIFTGQIGGKERDIRLAEPGPGLNDISELKQGQVKRRAHGCPQGLVAEGIRCSVEDQDAGKAKSICRADQGPQITRILVGALISGVRTTRAIPCGDSVAQRSAKSRWLSWMHSAVRLRSGQ
jgi:hypothetical protein